MVGRGVVRALPPPGSAANSILFGAELPGLEPFVRPGCAFARVQAGAERPHPHRACAAAGRLGDCAPVPATLRSLLWIALGGWIGSWAFFALVIARLAFRVLPSTEVAGQLVGPALATLHLYGAGAGVALAGLAALLRRGALRIGLPLVLSGACLVSELGVTPRMAAIRELAFGPDGNPEASARYAQLHGVSMGIFTAVLLGALVLAVLHARCDALQDRDSAGEIS